MEKYIVVFIILTSPPVKQLTQFMICRIGWDHVTKVLTNFDGKGTIFSTAAYSIRNVDIYFLIILV